MTDTAEIVVNGAARALALDPTEACSTPSARSSD